MEEKKFKFKFPSTAFFLLAIAFLFMVLSYIVPAGAYERVTDDVTGRTMVVGDSFQYVDSTPVSFFDWLASPYSGLLEVADIIAILFICGGALGVVIETGAIHAAIGALVKKVGHRENLVFVIIMLAFAICATTLNMAEEFIVFAPLLVVIAKSLGYDPLTGIAILLFGIYSGQGFSVSGPFTVIIAQQVADLPLLSGMGLRVVGVIGSVIIAIAYTTRYARRIKNDPTKSLVYDKSIGGMKIDSKNAEKELINLDDYQFTGKRKVVLLMLVATVLIMAVGTNLLGWWFREMCAIFLALAMVSGVFYFKSINKTIDVFMAQAGAMAQAAILLALSRAIVVVLTQGQLIDTIVHGLAGLLEHTSGVIAAWSIYLANIVINFFVPSSSGQAMVVMPILTPLADLTDITRQVAVHAFMSADAFGNMIIPTHPTTLACLGLAGISYNKWFKLAWPLVVLWSVWTFIILAIGVITNWGPY